MRSLAGICINNSHCIDFIYPHLTGRVNDFLTVQQYPYMCDLTFRVIKKSQVATTRFLQKSHYFALGRLL